LAVREVLQLGNPALREVAALSSPQVLACLCKKTCI